MEFGCFALSDNHYDKNLRDANIFASDITAEALYADHRPNSSIVRGG